MTRTELLELAETSPTTDVVTAGQAFGLGVNMSYELARRGEFPVAVLRIGRKMRVRTADLVNALGITVGEQVAAS